MANKKKRKRQREAAARRTREQAVTNEARKPKERWNAQTAQWEPEQVAEIHTYNVAAQIKDNGPVFQAFYRAPSVHELVKLICRHLSVDKESDLSFLEVHQQLDDGSVLLVIEGDKWPAGVGIIKNKGIIQKGNFGEAKRTPDKPAEAKILVPEIRSSVRARTPITTAVTTVTETVIERKIPRVPYALIQAA